MSGKRLISAEAEQYIIDHINDRPRTRMIRRAGVNRDAAYRVIHQHGGEIFPVRTAEEKGRIRETIARLYPMYSAREIFEQTGISPSTVKGCVQRLGLQHTEETELRLREKSYGAARSAHDRGLIDYEALSRRRKALFRLEYYRLWEGKPQETNLRLRHITRRAYMAQYKLCTRSGYKRDASDPYTLLYNAKTRRRDETYYTKKYGIKFTPETPHYDNGVRQCEANEYIDNNQQYLM
ncbi:MAG: hypothetical protein LUC22_02920 [Prevotella sp.]|nr:hypothetical protein [Prevotella sp.]